MGVEHLLERVGDGPLLRGGEVTVEVRFDTGEVYRSGPPECCATGASDGRQRRSAVLRVWPAFDQSGGLEVGDEPADSRVVQDPATTEILHPQTPVGGAIELEQHVV